MVINKNILSDFIPLFFSGHIKLNLHNTSLHEYIAVLHQFHLQFNPCEPHQRLC